MTLASKTPQQRTKKNHKSIYYYERKYKTILFLNHLKPKCGAVSPYNSLEGDCTSNKKKHNLI